MVNPQPTWSFDAKDHLTQWYGNVHLLENHVVGQWFTLERQNGKRLWEHDFDRANSIFEIVGDVILASETRSDGPWTANFGCCGIFLTTGELLWRWSGSGVWGRFVRMLDFVPGFTNDLRTTFLGVRTTECATSRGEILDIRTGQKIRRESDLTSWKKNYDPKTPAQRLYSGNRVEVGDGLFLSLREARMKVEKQANGRSVYSSLRQTRPFGFILTNSEKEILWDWSPEDMGLNPITNYFGWRLVGGKLLVLGGEAPEYLPVSPAKPAYVKPNPTNYHLIVLDVLSGIVSQKLSVGEEKVAKCRIEDADEQGFLLSQENKRLNYYPLVHGTN